MSSLGGSLCRVVAVVTVFSSVGAAQAQTVDVSFYYPIAVGGPMPQQYIDAMVKFIDSYDER